MPFSDPEKKRKHNRLFYYSKTKQRRRDGDASEDRRIPITIRIRQSIAARATRILHEGIARNTLSFRNSSQLYEHFIVQGIGTMKDEVAEEAMQYLRAVMPTDAIGNHRKEAQAAFRRVHTEINELLKIGAHDVATQYYWATYRKFQSMSPNVWRDWFIKQMQTSFPKLFHARTKGVALGAGKGKSR